MKAEQLRKAILQMAIQGKLVPQDPNDEPASVLLEKIRAEKQRLIKEGKIKKDKVDSVIFKCDDNRHYEKVGNNEPICIEDELPFEIPDSWKWVKIDNITYSVGSKENQILTSEILKQGLIPVVSQSQNLIDGYTNQTYKQIQTLPLIMFGDHTKVVKYIDFNFVIGADGTKFHKTILISSKYLYLLVSYYASLMPSRGYARHYSILKRLYMPLPPLAEQERIVAEIEKFEPLITEYDKLEQAKSKLDGEIYDKLKKSILQYAIQGKLVPQDENDEPASKLLKRIRVEKKAQLGKKYVDSYIYKGDDNCYYEHIDGKAKDEAIEVPFDLPNNWAWVRWGDLSYSIQYGYNAPAKERGRIKMVRISDIHDNTVDWTNVPFCDIDEKDINTYLLKTNDILFARTGGTVGKSYLVTDVPEDAIYAGYLIRTRYSSELTAQYLKYFMESSLYWEQLREGTIATAQPNCNGQTLSKMLLPIPPLAEQKRIVDKINEIFAKL